MFFSFNFFVLGINQTLGMYKLHLHRLQVFIENLQALLVLLYLQPQLRHKPHLFADDLVELFVLVIGVGWEVLVQVVLRDSVNDVFGHALFKKK